MEDSLSGTVDCSLNLSSRDYYAGCKPWLKTSDNREKRNGLSRRRWDGNMRLGGGIEGTGIAIKRVGGEERECYQE